MTVKQQIINLKEIFPKCVRRTFYALYKPYYNNLDVALNDFIATALLSNAILAILKGALPTNPLFDVSGLNPLILALILIINGLIFSGIFVFYA